MLLTVRQRTVYPRAAFIRGGRGCWMRPTHSTLDPPTRRIILRGVLFVSQIEAKAVSRGRHPRPQKVRSFSAFFFLFVISPCFSSFLVFRVLRPNAAAALLSLLSVLAGWVPPIIPRGCRGIRNPEAAPKSLPCNCAPTAERCGDVCTPPPPSLLHKRLVQEPQKRRATEPRPKAALEGRGGGGVLRSSCTSGYWWSESGCSGRAGGCKAVVRALGGGRKRFGGKLTVMPEVGGGGGVSGLC